MGVQYEEKEKYCKIFKILANRDAYPVYFHCHAGADRTGTVAALLKFMLGVSEDDVATDYELTSISPYGGRFRTHEMYDSFLKYLLTLGSTYKEAATNYLLSCGITEEEIQTLKDIYLK